MKIRLVLASLVVGLLLLSQFQDTNAGRFGTRGGSGTSSGSGISDAPSDGTTYGRKDAAWINVATSSDIDTEIDTVNQDIVNLRSNAPESPYYYFDGVNDYIEYADDADLDFGIGNFTLQIEFSKDNVTDANAFLINKEAGGIGYGLEIRQDDLWIRFDDNTTEATAIIGTACFEAGFVYNLFVTFDRDGDANAYLNGDTTPIGTVDISSANLTISNAGVLRIGTETGATTKPFGGTVYRWNSFNKALTAEEVRKYSNAAVDYKYKGASQTEQTSGTLTIGKHYILADWITGDDFTNVGAASNADGVEFVATGTTPTTWTNSSVVNQTGEVAAYEGRGIDDGFWYDSGSNDLDGTVSGATVNNTIPFCYIDALNPSADELLVNIGKTVSGSRTDLFQGDEDGDWFVLGAREDSDGDKGTAGQILSSTGTGTNWIAATGGGADTLVMGYIYRTNATGSSKNLGNNTWTIIDTWQSTGTFVNASWDGTNKGIIVDYDGYYKVTAQLSCINAGSGTNTYTISIGNTVSAKGQQISMSLDATWGYIPITLVSFAEFDATDTICLWGKNGTDGDLLTISMACMHVERITYKR